MALQNDGGSVATGSNDIDSAGLLLLRSGDNVKAFTRRCTHQGHPVNSFSDTGCTVRNQHGAEFNTNGQHISGPGGGSLKSYDTLLDGNTLDSIWWLIYHFNSFAIQWKVSFHFA